MDFTRKFEEATSNHIVRISALEIDKKCTILEARHTVTKFGPTVLLSIKDKSNNIIKVPLPKLYSSVFSEEDVIGSYIWVEMYF